MKIALFVSPFLYLKISVYLFFLGCIARYAALKNKQKILYLLYKKWLYKFNRFLSF